MDGKRILGIDALGPKGQIPKYNPFEDSYKNRNQPYVQNYKTEVVRDVPMEHGMEEQKENFNVKHSEVVMQPTK